MRRRKQNILEVLMELPWWVSVGAAAAAYWGIRFVLPSMLSGTAISAGLGQAAREHAWMFALFLLIPAPIAALRQYRRKRLFDAQADIASIRTLSWQQFEKLVAEVFERMGYSVVERGGPSADGGIDLVATARDEKVVVQCKHWRSQSVGVSIVREHYGVIMHEGATRGAIVVTGTFTPDAVAFAAGKPIQLIDGPKLERLVLSVRGSAQAERASELNPAGLEPALAEMTCPDCGAAMAKRTAKRGQFAGSAFLGCTRYPACRAIRQLG
jgi:restriction system protein